MTTKHISVDLFHQTVMENVLIGSPGNVKCYIE